MDDREKRTVTYSLSLLRGSQSRDRELTAQRHLSRQYETSQYCSRQPDLTVNLLPVSPTVLNVFENTNTPCCAWNFTNATIASNPFPNCQGALLVPSYSNFS